MIHHSLVNIFQHQDQLSFDQFALATLEGLMLMEREEYLKSKQGQHDSGNGTYLRNFSSLRTNALQIAIPRTRCGKFKPLLLELIHTQKEQLNQLALLLYRKGLSSRDVSEVMEAYFGHSISRETVNNLAESFHSLRKQWQATPLDAYYKVIYCDALFTSLKRGTSYSQEALHIIYGVKEDNTREILLLAVNPTESSAVWEEYLQTLKHRGVDQVDLIVADGLPGFSQVTRKHFPDSDIQRCVVHLQRSILRKVRPKDKESFSRAIKEAFNNFDKNSSQELAREKLGLLASKWEESYGRLVNQLTDEEFIRDYLTYICYPVEVRRQIYTTNSLENLNRQIRRVTKSKVSFDKVENLLDLVYMIIKDFEASNWQKYPVNTFQYWPKIHN